MKKLGERKRTNANAKGNKVGQTEIEEKERNNTKQRIHGSHKTLYN